MQDKVAIVTGAASGIGAEVSRQLVDKGANVVLVDIDANAGLSLADQLGACFVRCDVADVESCNAAVAECIERAGIPDFVHLNAGVMSVGANDAFLPIDEVPLANYRRIVGVNLDGVVFGLRALMPHMRERGGAITVTASIAGLIGMPIDPFYAATKHALVGLVRSVAQAMGDAPLRINAICPGAVDTPIVPDALKNGSIDLMPVAVLAKEVLDLLANGGQGEVRVRLSDSAFSVEQHALQ